MFPKMESCKPCLLCDVIPRQHRNLLLASSFQSGRIFSNEHLPLERENEKFWKEVGERDKEHYYLCLNASSLAVPKGSEKKVRERVSEQAKRFIV